MTTDSIQFTPSADGIVRGVLLDAVTEQLVHARGPAARAEIICELVQEMCATVEWLRWHRIWAPWLSSRRIGRNQSVVQSRPRPSTAGERFAPRLIRTAPPRSSQPKQLIPRPDCRGSTPRGTL